MQHNLGIHYCCPLSCLWILSNRQPESGGDSQCLSVNSFASTALQDAVRPATLLHSRLCVYTTTLLFCSAYIAFHCSNRHVLLHFHCLSHTCGLAGTIPTCACQQVFGALPVPMLLMLAGKMGVHFSVDSSGILKLDKAESVIESWEEYQVDVPIESPNKTETKQNITIETRETLETDGSNDSEVGAALTQSVFC